MIIEFVKSPTGAYNLAYFEGDRVDMPDHQALELIETGYAKKVTPVLPKEEKMDLPADLPMRKIILEAGIKTMSELKAYDELSDIPGIGMRSAKKIANYLGE